MTQDSPASSADIARSLARTRRLRVAAFLCLTGPIVTTIGIIIANRLSNGGLAFFVNGDPWTHRFWSAVFWTFFLGAILALLAVGRRCPRCGEGFFVRRGFDRVARRTRGTGGVNVFARRCVNCQLPLAGE